MSIIPPASVNAMQHVKKAHHPIGKNQKQGDSLCKISN
jgi:hypothetical protein